MHNNFAPYRIRRERIDRSLRAPASAADEPGLELFLTGPADQIRRDEGKRGSAEPR